MKQKDDNKQAPKAKDLKNSLAKRIQETELQNMAHQQWLDQTSFLLSTNNFENSINMTRDLIGKDAANISAIPAFIAGGNFGGAGQTNPDLTTFQMPDFAPTPLNQTQINNLDESNFNFEVGESEDPKHINYKGKTDGYALP